MSSDTFCLFLFWCYLDVFGYVGCSGYSVALSKPCKSMFFFEMFKASELYTEFPSTMDWCIHCLVLFIIPLDHHRLFTYVSDWFYNPYLLSYKKFNLKFLICETPLFYRIVQNFYALGYVYLLAYCISFGITYGIFI